MGARNALSALGKWWTRVRGLAFGYGLSDNIADAYQFLMKEYEEGDRVYLLVSAAARTRRGPLAGCCTCSACCDRETKG